MTPRQHDAPPPGDPVLDAAPDGVVTIDERGAIVELNTAAERIFGWSRAEALGRKVGDLFIPEAQRHAHESGLQRVLAGGESRVIGRRVRLGAQRADGRELVVDLLVTRTSEEPARFTAWIRDLSNADWAATGAKEEDEHGTVGSWSWTPSQADLRWSENVYRILGVHPGVTPDPSIIVSLTHPDDRERLRRRQSRAVVDGELEPVTYRIVRPDGQIRHLRTVVAVAERQDGQPHRLVGFVEDLTERTRARRASAAHLAADTAIAGWGAFEQGAQGLLAGLASALECSCGAVWLPCGKTLVARTVWREGTTETTSLDCCERGSRMPRGSDPVWSAFTARAATSGPCSVAIPAVFGEEVLAVVELRSAEPLVLPAPLMHALTGIGQELGLFLERRRDELDAPVLTPRELEVLALASRGLPAREIGEQLVISPATVKTHFENLYPKLGVSDRAAAVAAALRLGLIG
jgi:PAS domain S-box-containing protein